MPAKVLRERRQQPFRGLECIHHAFAEVTSPQLVGILLGMTQRFSSSKRTEHAAGMRRGMLKNRRGVLKSLRGKIIEINRALQSRGWRRSRASYPTFHTTATTEACCPQTWIAWCGTTRVIKLRRIQGCQNEK